MAKIVYRQMSAPRELPQQMPTHRAKARMPKPQGGGKFLVQIPVGAQGDGYGWNWYLHYTPIFALPWRCDIMKYSSMWKYFQ